MNIIFTRPLIDAEDLMKNFISSEHKIIHMPTLNIKSSNMKPLNTKDYDGLIFTSANAVRFLKIEMFTTPRFTQLLSLDIRHNYMKLFTV